MGAISLRWASLLAAAAILASQPHSATAQDQGFAPPVPEAEQAIVVTGSRIPRRNLTAVSPVTVIRAEEVQLQGVTLTEELLNRLPQVAPDQGAFISNESTGTATVNLRGLGAARTLVLLNGRRLVPGDPSYPAPDLSVVPPVLIKRIEVLTGGASSVYGSDAVGGVVNFILDTDLDGLRIDGQVSLFQHKNRIGEPFLSALDKGGIARPTGGGIDGSRVNLGAAYGTDFLRGRGHATVYGGYQEIERLTQDARDYSACTFVAEVETPDKTECGGSPAAFPANFFTNFTALRPGPNRTFETGLNSFNFGPWNFYQRPIRKYVAGGFADLEISDAIKPYAEVMYLYDRTVAQIAPSASFGVSQSINCDSPLLSDQQRSLVCITGNYVGEVPIFDPAGNFVGVEGSPTPFVDPVTGNSYLRGTLFAARRNVEGGPRRDERTHRNMRLLGGVKGELGRAISYDASFITSRVKLSSNYTNELSVTRIIRSLDVIRDPATGQPACRARLTGEDPQCVPWDIFTTAGVTPDAPEYLALAATRAGSVRQRVATAYVNFDLGKWGIRSPWSDEGPALNAGAEFREDRISYRPDAAYQSGDLAGTNPETPYSGSVKVKELFGEVRIPIVTGRLVDRLAFEGGYRQSWYSNPSNSFTNSSSKIALDFIPFRGIRFRGSRQRAVRAPNIVELFAPTIPGFFDNDPCAGQSPAASAVQCAATGVSASQYGRIVAVPPNGFFAYNSITGGNSGLGPETATTRTLGIVLEPRFLPGFSATADWFDISLKGAVAQIGSQVIMDSCIATSDPIFCGRIHRDSNGSLWLGPQGFIDDSNANIGSLRVRGIDIGANYTRDLGRFGSATIGFIGSYLGDFKVDNGGLSTPADCAGRYGYPCNDPLPKWRHNARLTWQGSGAPSLSLHWRHIGSMKLASIDLRPEIPVHAADAKLRAFDYFDLTGVVRVGPKFTLRAGVNNIFDRQPPVFVGNFPFAACYRGCNGNTYPQLYDPLGRFLFIAATVNWANGKR